MSRLKAVTGAVSVSGAPTARNIPAQPGGLGRRMPQVREGLKARDMYSWRSVCAGPSDRKMCVNAATHALVLREPRWPSGVAQASRLHPNRGREMRCGGTSASRKGAKTPRRAFPSRPSCTSCPPEGKDAGETPALQEQACRAGAAACRRANRRAATGGCPYNTMGIG